MMGSWWSSGANNALDEQIDKATGSSLEDIALNLEISDVIRSKTVQPREAMRSLKRRIGNKNPNIQLSALHLTDTCVKNGGAHFLEQIASREFMDNLVSLLHAVGPAAVNAEVRAKILELVQSWAAAIQGGYEVKYRYIDETYQTLQREGYQFPPRVTVASSMLDSSAPPEWTDSEVCMRCRTPFTFTNRKHHCRNCGNCFDQQCSAKTLPLPHLGIMQAVRVDDGCYARLTDKSSKGSSTSADPLQTTSFPYKNRSTSASMQPRAARVDDAFDEDLKKALAMSLEEVQSHSRGYMPPVDNKPAAAHTNGNKASTSAPDAEEEDDDLKAAIAASLADMEEQKQRHAAALKQQTSGSEPMSAPNLALPRNDYELSPVEAENINLFSTLVDRLQAQPPGTILREPRIQELYDSIGTLRPKLARTYGETMSKHDTLLDLHSKLSTVVRYYDRMLEDRLSKAYSQHSLGGYALPGPRQPSNPYPTIGSATGMSSTGAESYYTGEQPPTFSPPTMGHGYPPQPSQPQFAGYEKRGSVTMTPGSQYPPQTMVRSDSYPTQASPAQTQHPNPQLGYPPTEHAVPPPAVHPSQPPGQAPHNAAHEPAADQNAAYYYNQSLPADGHAASIPPDGGATYPNLNQPSNFNRQSVPPTPASVTSQPVQPPPQSQHYQQPPLAAAQSYWQQQQPQQQQQAAQPHAGQPGSMYQTGGGGYAAFSQDSFPVAPQHAPQQPVVEESLIDL